RDKHELLANSLSFAEVIANFFHTLILFPRAVFDHGRENVSLPYRKCEISVVIFPMGFIRHVISLFHEKKVLEFKEIEEVPKDAYLYQTENGIIFFHNRKFSTI
ncbi:hypothetical protein PMAYCL1PPCAC_08550, partial [Pristionchus mayeri]